MLDPSISDQVLQVVLKFPKFRLEDPVLVDSMFDLEDLVIDLLLQSEVGYFTGNEFGPETFSLFMAGPNCQQILDLVLPLFQKLPSLPGSYIVKKYGDLASLQEIWPLV